MKRFKLFSFRNRDEWPSLIIDFNSGYWNASWNMKKMYDFISYFTSPSPAEYLDRTVKETYFYLGDDRLTAKRIRYIVDKLLTEEEREKLGFKRRTK